MKREGWQNGNVRVSRNKLLRIAAAASAGGGEEEALEIREKGPAAKPTNASKLTSRCRRPGCLDCHYRPVTKARDKAKGAHKLRAGDVALNHRLVSWRVVDGGASAAGGGGIPDYKGASASAVLAYLAGSGTSWHEDDDDGGAFEAAPPNAGGGLSDLYDLIVGRHAAAKEAAGMARPTDIAVGEDTDAIEEQEQDGYDGKGDADPEEEEDLGFCMVGITIALEYSDGEEDWIVVEEI